MLHLDYCLDVVVRILEQFGQELDWFDESVDVAVVDYFQKLGKKWSTVVEVRQVMMAGVSEFFGFFKAINEQYFQSFEADWVLFGFIWIQS